MDEDENLLPWTPSRIMQAYLADEINLGRDAYDLLKSPKVRSAA